MQSKMDERERNALTTVGHEPIDSDVRAVWGTGAALAALVIATFVLIVGMMKWLERADGGTKSNYDPKTELNLAKQNSLQQLRSAEQEMLESYGWVGPEGRTARIPVGRAMEIISKTGLPAALQGDRSADTGPAQPSTPPPNQPEAPEGHEP